MILRLIKGGRQASGGVPTNDDLNADIVKMCNVFLHRENDTAIVATKFKHRGIYYEAEDGVTACDTQPGDAFGETVRDCFIASIARKRPEGLPRKRTDWPAYKLSKAKSVAQFEREWICVSVTGLNEANIMVRMETDPVCHDVALTKLCNPLVVERLGGDILLLRKQFLKWERA